MNLEHGKSTGIRDPVPNPAKYREFEEAGGVSGNDTWTKRHLHEAIRHFDMNPNDINPNPSKQGLLRATTNLLFDEFSNKGRLSNQEFKRLWLSSDYPAEFMRRPSFRK